MFIVRKYSALGTAMLLGLAGSMWVLAEDGREAVTKESPDLVSAEFAEHLDVQAASAALRDGDDETLLAIAEKLGAAERAANNTNVIPAYVFFQGAIRAAQSRHDAKALASIEQSIKVSMALKPNEKAALAKMIVVAMKFAAAPRKFDVGPGLKASDVSPESVSLYNSFMSEIRTTREYGREEDLGPLSDGIKQLSEFHPKQREHLLKLVGEARSMIKERGEGDPALMKVASASRRIEGASGYFRVVGPDSIQIGAVVPVVVIPSASIPPGANPIHLYARVTSPNTKLVGTDGALVTELTLPWSKSSRTISVKAVGPSVSAYSVTFGTDPKNQACRWSAINSKLKPQ